MKHTFRGLLGLAVLAVSANALADCSGSGCSSSGGTDTCAFPDAYATNSDGNIYGQTFYNPHPVQWSQFRRMSGVGTEKLHLFGSEEFYGLGSLALEWQQTTHGNRLAQWFSFANRVDGEMTYGPTSGEYDINSLNFGTTTSGVVSMCPRIQNFIADIDIFLGWDEFICGLWSRFSIPINWTRWNMRLEDTADAGTPASTFTTGQYTNTVTETDVPFANLKAAWAGNVGFGDAPALAKGKIDGRQSKTTVAGLKMELGYDFLRRERGHLALSFLVVAPTGNKPSAEFLFEPISGSAGSWEIGGDINGHWNFWENADCNQSLGLHADVALVTALKHEQTRLFGLKAGSDHACSAGASYLMLKELDSSNNYVGLARAANVLALKSSIGAGFEVNLGLLLKYMRNNWSVDFGYELYHRSAEKICGRDAITADKYVVNGGTVVYGTADDKSYSKATISTDVIADSTTVYVKDSDVCVCTALQPSYLSNKFFNNYQYAWNNCDWEPTLGLGYSYEVGASRQGVKNIAVNQWSVMAKGSISF